tara:strand:+ start:323 stop:532 length:210 start_codon:yes stop_codon:yes gene_type:complete
MESKNTISIDGEEYDIDSLDEEQAHWTRQIRSLQAQAAELNMRGEQVNAAEKIFVDLLAKSLKEKSDDK